MTASKQIVSVFGSVEAVSEKLKAPEFSEVTVHSALEIILSGAVGLEISEESSSALAKDMCFLSVASDLTESSLSNLLSDASLLPAPLNIQMQGGATPLKADPGAHQEDDLDDPLKALSDDMEMSTTGDSMSRLQDTVSRIRAYTMMLPDQSHDKDQIDPHMATVLDSDSALGAMLPEDASSGFVLCQLASVDTAPDGSISVVHDVEAPVLISGIIRKILVDDEEGSIDSDPSGDQLFVSNRSLSYIVESGTPSIITVIVPKSSDSVEVRSWFVYLDSVDGMSPVVSQGIMKTVSEDIDSGSMELEYVWPADITLSPLHISGPMYSQEDLLKITMELMPPDDEDDDEDED